MSVYEQLLAGETGLAVVGLGYVGMPLALAFAEHVKVVGFDIDSFRVELYKNGIDPTAEAGSEALKRTTVRFTSDETALRKAHFIIVAVPTPVTDDNMPDLGCVLSACDIVGRNLSPGSIVCFESTVYAGVTEEICAPALEAASGLVCGKDFKIGYSPERINPGDKINRLDNIVKIVAGMDEDTTDEMSRVYELAVDAGVFRAKNIRVAELAKLVENAQRDVNIAFMNELSIIFKRLGVDSIDVINAMNTKWNALHFSPGLVGGHCISVDPNYLIYQAERQGYRSLVVHAGRKVNDDMGAYVADSAIRQMIKADQIVKKAKVYILGVTYKENCPDIRNTMVFKIIKRLEEYGIQPQVYDPLADKADIKHAADIDTIDLADIHDADCLIFAVAHQCFTEYSMEDLSKLFSASGNSKKVVIDVKNIFKREDVENMGYMYWCL